MNYYVQIYDKAFGPLTKERILRLIQLKKITHSTIVSVDAENWKTLDSFPELVGTKEPPVFQLQPSSQDSAQWNYSLDGIESVGPITFDELYNLVKSGFLNAETIVWKEGDSESFIMRDVQEFADLFPPAGKTSKNFFGRFWGQLKKIFPLHFHFGKNTKQNSAEVENGR